MKIVVDRDRCNSLGVCESISPDHFEINDDGDLDLLREDVAASEQDLIRRAVTSCPSGALSLVEDSSG
ncbi:ferredoxin [Nocardioides sp. Soil797]|nr:ferredoxin [Nocardioides sp. Soil797]